MKAFKIFALPALITVLAASAAAQVTTDEARAWAARATAEQQREASARRPIAEPVAAGDYRAQAHQEQRMLQWQSGQDAARAYAAGVRSQPLPVNSEESARAEVQRVHAQQALAQQAEQLHFADSQR